MKKVTLVMLLVIALGGCESPKYTHFVHNCPEAKIIRDLSRQTYRDTETNVIMAEVNIDEIRPFCKAEDDSVHMILRPSFTAVRRSNDKNDEVKVEYFIALLDREGNILDKQLFPLTMEFDGESRRTHTSAKDTFVYELPAEGIEARKVYVGLQISREQVMANRYRYNSSVGVG